MNKLAQIRVTPDTPEGLLERLSREASLLPYALQLESAVPGIEALLNRVALSGGKRLRPLLVLLMGRAHGFGDFAKLEPYAIAAEWTHTASLAHDDVIDEASERRGKPSVPAASSNSRAVLSGDLLLARVMVELSRLGRVEIIHGLSKAVEDLVSGEWLQLEARHNPETNYRNLEITARLKTGSLMGWCCAVAAWLQGDTLRAERLRTWGENVGVAFQMIDDVLDFEATSGKPFAQDLESGLVNFVVWEMTQARPELIDEIRKKWRTPAQKFEWNLMHVAQAQERVRARAGAKVEAARLELRALFKDQTDSVEVRALELVLDSILARKL